MRYIGGPHHGCEDRRRSNDRISGRAEKGRYAELPTDIRTRRAGRAAASFADHRRPQAARPKAQGLPDGRDARQTGSDAHPQQVLRSRSDGRVRCGRVHHRPRQRLLDSASGRAAGARPRGGVQDYGRARRHYQARRIRGFQNTRVLANRPVWRRVAQRAPSRRPAWTGRQDTSPSA